MYISRVSCEYTASHKHLITVEHSTRAFLRHMPTCPEIVLFIALLQRFVVNAPLVTSGTCVCYTRADVQLHVLFLYRYMYIQFCMYMYTWFESHGI